MTMTTKKTTPSWFSIGMDAWTLAAESQMVIALRLGKFATRGPLAAGEAERMVSEKLAAQLDLGMDLVSGKLGCTPADIVSSSIKHYSKRVTANRKRLAK